jgi:hypothetical protein
MDCELTRTRQVMAKKMLVLFVCFCVFLCVSHPEPDWISQDEGREGREGKKNSPDRRPEKEEAQTGFHRMNRIICESTS